MSEFRQTTITKLRSYIEVGLPVRDNLFDYLLDQDCFDAAQTHWTPAAAVPIILEMLKVGPETSILDVGSGCGKFCILAALSSSGVFTGIEIRPWLHRQALSLKYELAVENAEFLLGDMTSLDWSLYQGIYLYNPFYENILDEKGSGQRVIGYDLEFSKTRYDAFTRTVSTKLASCATGTRVVTFHGFGGQFPAGYVREALNPLGRGEIELWVKH